jgi:hypothetical protein
MNVRRTVVPLVCFLASLNTANTASAQQPRVDPGSLYSRIYVIVPMIGSGTWNDPKRPMFAPVPQQMTPGNRTGIIAFNHVESDNGNFALIEIVMATRSQLVQLIGQVNTQLAGVTGFQLFDRSTTSLATVQTAFQALKKNFDITKFRVVVP